MTSAFEERFTQRKYIWIPAFLALLIAFIGVQTTHAAYFRPQMVFVQSSSQRVDTNGDGQLETYSAAYTVYDDGTAEGAFFLDDNYKVIVESGTIDLGPNGELIVIVKGTNLEHEVGHVLGIHHVPSSSTGGGGGGIIIDYDIIDAANHSATFSAETQLTIR